MSDSGRILTAVAVGAAVFSAVGFLAGRCSVRKEYVTTEVHDTTVVTTVVHDTVRLTQRVDRIRTDTVAFVSTVHDTVEVEVPIEQKTFEGDNYRAVVEGWRPSLVSMDVFQTERVITNTVTIAPKSWTFGVTFGAVGGIVYTPKGWQPGAGVGVGIGLTHHF